MKRQIRNGAVYTMKLASLSFPNPTPPPPQVGESPPLLYSQYSLLQDCFVIDHVPRRSKSLFKTQVGTLVVHV
jgi:hypothetical protein